VRLAMLKPSSSFLPNAKARALLGTEKCGRGGTVGKDDEDGDDDDDGEGDNGSGATSVGSARNKKNKNKKKRPVCACRLKKAPLPSPIPPSSLPLSASLFSCMVCSDSSSSSSTDQSCDEAVDVDREDGEESLEEEEAGLTLDSMCTFWLPLLFAHLHPNPSQLDTTHAPPPSLPPSSPPPLSLEQQQQQQRQRQRPLVASPQLFVCGNVSASQADDLAECVRVALTSAQPAVAAALIAHAGSAFSAFSSSPPRPPPPPSSVEETSNSAGGMAVIRQPIVQLKGLESCPTPPPANTGGVGNGGGVGWVSERVTVTVSSEDATQKNSACELYWQIGPAEGDDDDADSGSLSGSGYGLLRRVLGDLLEQVMSEPLFDTLRTQEQLGYSVSCGARLTSGVVGFGVEVLSDTHHPIEVEARVLAFLRHFRQHTLEDMSAAEFRDQCESLASLKLERSLSLDEDAAAFWDPIADHRVNGEGVCGAFFEDRVEATALGKVSLQMLRAAMDEWILAGLPTETGDGGAGADEAQSRSEGGARSEVPCAHLAVHCIGRSAATAQSGAAKRFSPPPPPGQAKLEVSTVAVGAKGAPSGSVWLGRTEDAAGAFAQGHKEFPCFVSGARNQ